MMPVPYTCKLCGREAVGFSVGGGGSWHYCDECKPAARRAAQQRKNEMRNARYASSPERRMQRAQKSVERYGITWDRYESMLAQQGGVCAICGSAPSGNGTSGQRLHVDHDHACCSGRKSCGKCVRGLLCSNCNQAIGYFQDDPQLLLAAGKYLDR